MVGSVPHGRSVRRESTSRPVARSPHSTSVDLAARRGSRGRPGRRGRDSSTPGQWSRPSRTGWPGTPSYAARASDVRDRRGPSHAAHDLGHEVGQVDQRDQDDAVASESGERRSPARSEAPIPSAQSVGHHDRGDAGTPSRSGGACVGLGAEHDGDPTAAAVEQPSPKAPLCVHKLVEAIVDAGAPSGAVNTVFGDAVAPQLVSDPRVDFVSFTGSIRVGKIIRSSVGMKRVALELGGVGPTFVHHDADLASAAKAMRAQRRATRGPELRFGAERLRAQARVRRLRRSGVARARRHPLRRPDGHGDRSGHADRRAGGDPRRGHDRARARRGCDVASRRQAQRRAATGDDPHRRQAGHGRGLRGDLRSCPDDPAVRRGRADLEIDQRQPLRPAVRHLSPIRSISRCPRSRRCAPAA